MYAVFIPATKKATVCVLDTVKSNQMPNLANLYNNERTAFLGSSSRRISTQGEGDDGSSVPEESYSFEVRIENDIKEVHRTLNKTLAAYKEEKRGPTIVVSQTLVDLPVSSKKYFISFPDC